ncbi:hypothetical protein RCL_jg27134.t1 [Rhizophagus clarus]|uniref:Uncharacterized protein n=1 Tax=Rhizophagus clarus TaxID=94130 RepID=A0A8H3MB00_9GLOM|nr:hypothetical protein RCL_jg27134.t1 [Rhizophagus clarus]
MLNLILSGDDGSSSSFSSMGSRLRLEFHRQSDSLGAYSLNLVKLLGFLFGCNSFHKILLTFFDIVDFPSKWRVRSLIFDKEGSYQVKKVLKRVIIRIFLFRKIIIRSQLCFRYDSVIFATVDETFERNPT